MSVNTDIPWVRTMIALGGSMIRGVDPHAAADTIDRATRARGGSPVDVWRVVYRLAAERLDLLGAELPACVCKGATSPTRCLSCGGALPPPRVTIESP